MDLKVFFDETDIKGPGRSYRYKLSIDRLTFRNIIMRIFFIIFIIITASFSDTEDYSIEQLRQLYSSAPALSPKSNIDTQVLPAFSG